MRREPGDELDGEAPTRIGYYMQNFFTGEKLGILLSLLTKSLCETAACSFFFLLCVHADFEAVVRSRTAQFHGGDHNCGIASHETFLCSQGEQPAGTFEPTLINGVLVLGAAGREGTRAHVKPTALKKILTSSFFGVFGALLS